MLAGTRQSRGLAISAWQEDGTEVLSEKEEATSIKPVSEGLEDPLSIINSTHYNQYNS